MLDIEDSINDVCNLRTIVDTVYTMKISTSDSWVVDGINQKSASQNDIMDLSTYYTSEVNYRYL